MSRSEYLLSLGVSAMKLLSRFVVHKNRDNRFFRLGLFSRFRRSSNFPILNLVWQGLFAC